MDSLSSSPLTPATSIAPPATPPPRSSARANPSTPLIDPPSSDSESEHESPLLNSLQLSPNEQSYLDQISSAPRTPVRPPTFTRSHKHTMSIPAYKFPSLRSFNVVNSSPSTPTGSRVDIFKDVKINELPQGGVSKLQGNRYSVYVQNEDFEIPERKKWFKHGKNNSFGSPGGWFLKNHKKSRSEF